MTDKIACPYCHEYLSKVIDTRQTADGGVRRRRQCLACHERFSTTERYERYSLTDPRIRLNHNI